MNRFRLCNQVLWMALGLAVLGTFVTVARADAEKKPQKKKLTGQELYAINCNRCHTERYPTERTPAQWKTIVTHMRVRANLPADQAKAILKYLQEDAGK